MSDAASDTPHNSNGGAPQRPAPRGSLPSDQGTIRHYDAGKGFGFIVRYGASDVFFHVSDLVDGNIAVEIGQKVKFDLEPSPRKPGTFVAVRVQRYGFEGGNSGQG